MWRALSNSAIGYYRLLAALAGSGPQAEWQMGSLGETLRQARLDRGASLVDAERDTRVRRKYLEALEAEDYASLPALVHTRGFIRVYARYLGLDPDATLDLFGPGRVREERPALRPATPRLSAGRPAAIRLFMVL